MKVAEIKAVLSPMGILRGINQHRDEPTPLFHCVSVDVGMARVAIKAIKQAGGDAWHGLAWGYYTESISVRRK